MTDRCECATRFKIEMGRREDYRRGKKLLNASRHPVFVGRRQAFECADQGGMLFATYEGEDVGLCYIRPKTSTLWVISIMPGHQGHGLGAAVLNYTAPNFARVIEDVVPWFEARGYTAIGRWHQGRRYRTKVMVRNGLMELSGRVAARIGDRCRCTDPAHHADQAR